MRTQHTPAPWFVFRDGRCVGGPAKRPEGEPQTAGIAMCGMQLRAQEEVRANALLIAAAPDLLQACREAAVWLEGWSSAEQQLSMLYAAIAKATEGA